jgi:hypothetical protein
MCLYQFNIPEKFPNYYCLILQEEFTERCPSNCVCKVNFASGRIDELNLFKKECINLKLVVNDDERMFLCAMNLVLTPDCLSCPFDRQELVQKLQL